MSLKKTGGGDYQQHFLSPVEEQLAVICNIFHAVEGISKAKSFGAESKKKVEFEEDMQIEHVTISDPIVLESQNPPSAASPLFTPEMSPRRKKSHFSGDIKHLMDEETKNFKHVAQKMEEMNNNMKEYTRYLRHMYKNMEEICSLKKKELSEIKRHHLELEKVAHSRNEMKLEFLKLEKMKLGMEED